MGKNPHHDLHPHDPLLSGFFTELLAAKEELNTQNRVHDDVTFREPLAAALIRAAGDNSNEACDPASVRLRRLLQSKNFFTALPVLLERLSTPVERLNLPNRGKSRNLARGELDTFYTPIDLAVWVASLTAKRACERIVGHAKADAASPTQLLGDLISLRVADFSCGSAVLLREAAEYIVRAYAKLHESFQPDDLSRLPVGLRFFRDGQFKLQCLSTNLYGIDISGRSVDTAKLVLLLWASEEWRGNHSALFTISMLLGLNLKQGSGSHWQIGRDEMVADQSIHSKCVEEGQRRASLKEEIINGAAVKESNHPNSEIAYMFPEAFVDSSRSGFSCIVGNPPYGELPVEFESQVSKSLFNGALNVNRARNQYVKFASSLVHLLNNEGFGAMICPLGLAYHNADTKSLRNKIQLQRRRWNFAFFDRSPDALFGDTVKTRNAVLYCEPSLSGSPEIATTHLLRWTRPLRPQIWPSIRPVPISGSVDIGELIPKVGSELELNAWRAIRSQRTYLLGALLNNGHDDNSALYCYSTAYNWLPFFRINPATFAEHGKHASPSTRTYVFHSSDDADFFYACLVSSVSFWLWTVESDGFHLSNAFVEKLPYSAESFSPETKRELIALGQQHDALIRKFPVAKANAGKTILNFNRHGASDVVERIDALLISALGIPKLFLEILHTRVRDLIFAGRQTTRVHSI